MTKTQSISTLFELYNQSPDTRKNLNPLTKLVQCISMIENVYSKGEEMDRKGLIVLLNQVL